MYTCAHMDVILHTILHACICIHVHITASALVHTPAHVQTHTEQAARAGLRWGLPQITRAPFSSEPLHPQRTGLEPHQGVGLQTMVGKRDVWAWELGEEGQSPAGRTGAWPAAGEGRSIQEGVA